MSQKIDKLEDLDLERIKRSDLLLMYFTGQSISCGSGRNKRYTYRKGVETPLGDIELSVWLKAAEYVVERDGLREEVSRLQPYVSGSADNLSLPRDPYGLCRLFDSCLSELYRDKNWVYFTEYNMRYHPELLLEHQ